MSGSDEPLGACHSIIIDEQTPRCWLIAIHHPFRAYIIANRKSSRKILKNIWSSILCGENSARPWFRTVTSLFDKQNFPYISGKDVFFRFSCEAIFGREEWITRRVTDVERLAEESSLSADKLSIYVRASFLLFILLCPFFAFLKKSMPIFQRSRCKDTNFIFGTVSLCHFVSLYVTLCHFYFVNNLEMSKKMSIFANWKSISLT